MKMPYKVCFHMSYRWGYRKTYDGQLMKPVRYHGKLHYCGHSLEECVAKIINKLARYEVTESGVKAVCTSMWIMRGSEKDEGQNIKWADYVRRGRAKEVWEAALLKAVIERDAELDKARQARRYAYQCQQLAAAL